VHRLGILVSADHHDDAIRSAMAELTHNFAVGTPIEDTLASVTATAVDLIPGVDSADVLLIHDGQFRSTATTSALAPTVDQAQLRTGEGPCLDAAGSAVTIRCDDLRTDTRWPAFAPAAVESGVHSVMSYQLYTHGANTGALNLFGLRAGVFNDESEAIGAMLATHAAIALIAANRQHQFESALASRDVIGQAKGIMMERFRIDAVRAFELLTRASQNSNTPVHVIAAETAERAGRFS
jgi:transcriptional regulator with GAF, ATPase, and Fis domain